MISVDPAVEAPTAAFPILATDDLLVVASSRIGFVAVDAKTLTVTWRKGVVPAGGAFEEGGAIALPVAGAVEMVGKDGASAGRRESPIGGGRAWPGGVWAHGGVVSVGGKEVKLRDGDEDPAGVSVEPVGAVWKDGAAGPAGFLPFPEPLVTGSAGPIGWGGGIAYVADDMLVTPQGVVEGRWARALAAVGGTLRAIQVSGGVARPVIVGGKGGQGVEATSVLAADIRSDGAVLALVHNAKEDTLHAWNAAGSAVVTAVLPPPPDEAVRYVPAQVRLRRDAGWAFVDGRVILRLPPP